jgi:hypothetical protein
VIRGVLFSVALSALLIYAVYRMVSLFELAKPEGVTRIDIYDDRITYRTSTYETTSRLAVGLKAAQDPPRIIGLHDCARMDEFEAVVDVLRELRYTNFSVELPDDC